MPIYFCNEEPMDLDVLRIMGVSVKKTDNPIGMFGTGLKFATATLLRTGHEMTISIDGVEHVLGIRAKKIRDEEFDLVMIDDEELAFTTKLGINWEPWMAFREIYSNTLDERGTTMQEEPDWPCGTVIRVEGEAFERAYLDRRTIFLETRPEFEHGAANIHAGSGSFGFYRGVRVHKLRAPTLYTYDIQTKQTLTEDRTLQADIDFSWEVRKVIEACEDEAIVEAVLLAPESAYEHTLGYGAQGTVKPSKAFKSVVNRHRDNAHLNQSAKKWVERTEPVPVEIEEVETEDQHDSDIEEAFILLARLDCTLDRADGFIVIESLGPDVFGQVRDGKIFIDRKTLERGPRFIASTLYEEWLHRTQGYEDCSRSLQNLLFEKLLYFVDKAPAETG